MVLLAILFFTGCSLPSSVFSATIFVGIGNDGYFHDVEGMLGAISSGLQMDGGLQSHVFKDGEGSEILRVIRDINSIFHSGDTMIWYYSGHSRRVKDTDHDETGPDSWAASSYDETIGLRNHPDRITDDELSLAFSAIASKNVRIITIFDTCYAGGFVGGEKDLNSVNGLTFMGSSGEKEDSFSISGQPYSVFTQGLINAIADASGDYDGNGILSTGEWLSYASIYVDSTIVSDQQHPAPLYGPDVAVGRFVPVPLPVAAFLLATGFGLLVMGRAVHKSIC